MEDLKHDYLSALKRIASELGRVPSRDQFYSLSGYHRRQVEGVFGGYTQLLHAAGLTPHQMPAREKQVREALAKNLEAEMNRDIPKPIDLDLKKGWSGIFIGDPHAPSTSKEALKKLYCLAEKKRPTVIGCVGDAYDMFAWSKFPRSHNWYTPKQEIELARRMLSSMWEELRRVSPRSRFIQVVGNHDVRPIRSALIRSPELEIFCDLKPWLNFDGVETFMDPREIVMIDKLTELTHGHWAKPGDYALATKRNVIHGHTHQGRTTFVTLTDSRVVWEASSGHMADIRQVPMQYTPKKETPSWSRGVTMVDELGPRFIHL